MFYLLLEQFVTGKRHGWGHIINLKRQLFYGPKLRHCLLKKNLQKTLLNIPTEPIPGQTCCVYIAKLQSTLLHCSYCAPWCVLLDGWKEGKGQSLEAFLSWTHTYSVIHIPNILACSNLSNLTCIARHTCGLSPGKEEIIEEGRLLFCVWKEYTGIYRSEQAYPTGTISLWRWTGSTCP